MTLSLLLQQVLVGVVLEEGFLEYPRKPSVIVWCTQDLEKPTFRRYSIARSEL
jgi:hypothetical protein